MRGSDFKNEEDDIMTKKDLILTPSKRGLKSLSRFGDRFFDEFDRIFGDWDLDMRTFVDMQPKAAFPKVNVSETEDQYEVEVALAGFNKEDISMELKDNCLCIKADKKEEVSEEDASKKYLMKEISSRSFRRALNFKDKVETEDIDCTFKEGIVKCILNKKKPEIKEDDTVKIEILS
jgi:HSP20 family molecular chaperone IbpA